MNVQGFSLPLLILAAVAMAGCTDSPAGSAPSTHQEPQAPRIWNVTANYSGALEPILPYCPVLCAPAEWVQSVGEAKNLTIVSISVVMTWEAEYPRADQLRLQVYHDYPVNEDGRIGRDYHASTSVSPLIGEVQNLTVPVYDEGKLLLVVMHAFHQSGGQSYQVQSRQSFDIQLVLGVREILPADVKAQDPPQWAG